LGGAQRHSVLARDRSRDRQGAEVRERSLPRLPLPDGRGSASPGQLHVLGEGRGDEERRNPAKNGSAMISQHRDDADEASDRLIRIPAVRALLLDLDGTVANTHEMIFQCFSETLRKHLGRICPRPVWEKAVGLPLEEVFAAALEHFGELAPAPELLAVSYRERLPELEGAVAAFPGMPEALRALRQSGIRLAIVTTKHQPAVARHLRILGMEELFEAVISGDQCSRCKPDPEPFTRAVEALGVPASEAAGVGDSAYDILSARAAGVFAVGACWGTADRAALLSAGPDWVLERPEGLRDFL
jgi:pyrophosphatase PpaX